MHLKQFFFMVFILAISSGAMYGQDDRRLTAEMRVILEKESALLDQARLNLFSKQPSKAPMTRQAVATLSADPAKIKNEYDALMALYKSTSGANWTNNTGWRDADPNTVQSVRGWYGVTVNGNGYVTGLNLTNNKLQGVLPSGIGNLTFLESLKMDVNALNGVLPVTLGHLSHLTHITLRSNQFSGEIPPNIGITSVLQWLELGSNQFTGTLPENFKNYSALVSIEVENNKLKGPIPNWLGAMPKLWYIRLSYNEFSGSIPTPVVQSSTIKYLFVEGNQLSGSIPTGFSSYNNRPCDGQAYPQVAINLSDNKFTGQVPSDFKDLVKFKALPSNCAPTNRSIAVAISENQLDGDMPALISNQNEIRAHFDRNRFTFSNLITSVTTSGPSLFDFMYQPQDSIDERKHFNPGLNSTVILEAAIDRQTSPACTYQWFKYVDGKNDTPMTPAPDEQGHTFTIPNFDIANGGHYYYKIWNTAAPQLVLSSRMQTLVSPSCPDNPSMAIETLSAACAVTFNAVGSLPAQYCHIDSYLWDFGDGSTDTKPSPVHPYNRQGTYNVTLTLKYTCGSCHQSVTVTKQVATAQSGVKDLLLSVATEKKPNVIQTQAATFSDVWPMDHTDATLDSRSAYFNGTRGVWRNDATYVYDVPRSQSSPVSVAKDGTFTLEQFNWGAPYDLIPHWTKANEMTRYSPYSYELENRDVLGVYSAALYDYGGHLPSAHGVNMRNDEMAFTGFESGANTSGNWMISNKAAPAFAYFKVQSANKNIAMVEASLKGLDEVTQVDVIARRLYWKNSIFSTFVVANQLSRTTILCKQKHPTNPGLSIVVLEDFPLNDTWTGQLRIRKQVVLPLTATLDNTKAHTGKSSMKVSGAQTFRQRLLQLDSGKSYFLNAWVTVDPPTVKKPPLATGLGITVTVKRRNGTVVQNKQIQPEGPIVEGWQQVRGSFLCPVRDAFMEITFLPGSTGTAWYDDLRMHPEKGNMTSYVYDLRDYRLQAVLDEENFATLYYYDDEGNLYLTKKETAEGIKTLSETVSYIVERQH